MVVIRRGGPKVNFDDLRPYDVIIDNLMTDSDSDETSNREKFCTLITPDQLEEDLAPIHVGDAQVLETRIIHALPDFDREGEAIERGLAVEHSKYVCNIMDSFEFPVSAHRLDSLRAPVLTAEDKLALDSAFADRPFASKIFLVRSLLEQE